MQLIAYGAQDISAHDLYPTGSRHCALCHSVCRLRNKVTWSFQDVASAITAGHITCLTKAKSKRVLPSDEGLCKVAAETSINMLEVVHKDLHMPWDDRTPAAAAESNNEECLLYTIRNGAPLCENVCLWIAEKGNADCVSELRRRLNKGDHITSRLLVDCEACKVAAYAGNLHYLKFDLTRTRTRTHGQTTHTQTQNNAETLMTCVARSGKEECLRYVFLHYQILTRAADSNVNIYGRRGLALDRCGAIRVCAAAARSGNIECLRFAYDAILAPTSDQASDQVNKHKHEHNDKNVESSIFD